MSKGITSGLVLLTLGLVMGLLLAVVNALTAPTILANENQAKYDALAEFYDLGQYTIEEVTVTDSIIDSMYLLSKDGNVEAIVYSVTKYGFQSDVKMLIAVSSSLTVDGYKVVSQAETAGYGALSPTHDFNMDGVSITDIASFDGISGATITSTAIKDCFTEVFARAANDFGGAN